MASEPATALPARALEVLGAGIPVILVTTGEDGWGHAVITWAVAPSVHQLRFGVDVGTRTVGNLVRTSKAALEIIAAGGLTLLVKGRARRLKPKIDAAPFGMELWELDITDVHDQAFGGVVVHPMRFEWTGPQADRMASIERAVLHEMRTWHD